MKLKKLFATINAATIAVSSLALSSFASEDLFTFEPTSQYVKTLGRTEYTKGVLLFSLTNAGIEYDVTGTTTSITLAGDSQCSPNGKGARIGFFVDGDRVKDYYLRSQDPTTITLDLGAKEKHTVRVIKLSESADNSIAIDEITADGEITPTAEKAHKIEFIGDSITCGFGIDGGSAYGEYSPRTEDGSRTYAYKTAEKFDADYSMVSYSGYGVISGYTSAGQLNLDQTVDKYYDKLGFSYGYYQSQITVSQYNWDFSRYTPDLVVINLGTNDHSYTAGNSGRIAEFSDGYVDFLKMVREKNPNAEILCTLGIMGQELYNAIETAVSTYTNETGDTKVNTFKFDVQDMNNDGVGTSYHPTEKTHYKAANKLIAEIEKLYGWEVDPNVTLSYNPDILTPEDPSGSGDDSSDSSSAEPIDVEGTVVWEGSFDTGAWNATLDTKVTNVPGVKAGDTLRVYVEPATGAQIQLIVKKTMAGWDCLGEDYYNVPSNGILDIKLTEELASQLVNGKGIFVQGANAVVRAITYSATGTSDDSDVSADMKVYYQTRSENTEIRFVAEVDMEAALAAPQASEETLLARSDDTTNFESVYGQKNITKAYRSLIANGEKVTAPEGRCYLVSTAVLGVAKGDTVKGLFTLDGENSSRVVGFGSGSDPDDSSSQAPAPEGAVVLWEGSGDVGNWGEAVKFTGFENIPTAKAGDKIIFEYTATGAGVQLAPAVQIGQDMKWTQVKTAEGNNWFDTEGGKLEIVLNEEQANLYVNSRQAFVGGKNAIVTRVSYIPST